MVFLIVMLFPTSVRVKNELNAYLYHGQLVCTYTAALSASKTSLSSIGFRLNCFLYVETMHSDLKMYLSIHLETYDQSILRQYYKHNLRC